MKLIKFETPTCNPCKAMDMLMKVMGVAVDEKVNVLDDPAVAEDFGVMKVPTLLLVDDEGNVVDRVIGMDEDQVKAIFEKAGKI